MKLNLSVHNEHTLSDQLEAVRGFDPDCYLVGSLGRAAAYQYLLGDSMHEYHARGRQPYQRFNGTAADLDLVGTSDITGGEQSQFGPFEVDTKSFKGRQVTIVKKDGDWVLRSANRSFEAEIEPETMEPIKTRTVYGVDCLTLPPQTLLALLGLNGTLRDQDLHAQQVLTSAIRESSITPLPPKYYEPFEELSRLNQSSKFNQLRTAYRAIVPSAIRKPLAPILQPIKEHLLH